MVSKSNYSGKRLARRQLFEGALSLSGLGVLGCGSPSSKSTGGNAFEFFHWWTGSGEKEAMDALLARYQKLYPNDELINAAQSSADQARARLRSRMLEQQPPDSFQENIGLSLKEWVTSAYSKADSYLTPLNGLALDEGWMKAIPPQLIDALSVNGMLYGVPLNVHRTNTSFYNLEILDRYNRSIPQDLSEFFDFCEELSAKSKETADPTMLSVVAIGSNQPWTLNNLVWENILPAMYGGEFYQSYFQGKEQPDCSEIVEVAKTTQRLWQHVNLDAHNLQWDDAVSRVHTGKAAVTIMGDWAKGTLLSLGSTLEQDFEQSVTFGADKEFIYTSDAFTLTSRAPNFEAAVQFLKLAGSVEGQELFNPIKGSIPARTDCDSSLFDAASRRNFNDFKTSTLSLAQSGIAPLPFGEAIQKDLVRLVNGGRIEELVFALSNRYPMLTAS